MEKRADEKDYDAIVVGSGPGGATVARELSRRRKDVLILERGPDLSLKEGFVSTGSIVNTVSVGTKLSCARAFTTGGTTALYFAVADMPPVGAFLSVGIDLSTEIEEAKRDLPLVVLPDRLVGAQAQRVRESALALGYPWEKNMMLVSLSQCASGYSYESKWKARTYVQEAVKKGATLVAKAIVRKVLLENKRAVGVEFVADNRGHREVRRAFGARIILAAGGTVTPLILRDSGVEHVGEGGFYCYPNFAVFGLVSGLGAGDNFVGCMGARLDDSLGLGDANAAPTFYRMVMLRSYRFVRAWLHSQSIGVGVMVKDRIGGGMRPDGRYYKEVSRDDSLKLKKGEQIARQIIQKAGGKHIFRSALGAAHVGGSVRIREHVDENLETEYRNLHICDASVIPDRAQINSPTFTLVCLGKYLANRLSPVL